MVKIVPFEDKHVDQFNFVGQKFLDTDIALLLHYYAAHGPAFTILNEKEIIGIAGVVILWPGVGEAWTFLNPSFKRYAKSIHRAVKEKLQEIMDTFNLHRVQTTVLDGFEAGIRWVKRLGFEEEGIMKAYGPNGEDFIRFARVRKCQA